MGPIGIFDSGYGGLTVLSDIRKALPQYDYIYLGDNARTPYGSRSFETVYEYTLEAVKFLFKASCHLVIVACNTASAKALRSIQQKDLPALAPDKRVLGVIRPTTEIIGNYSSSREIGLFATPGTVRSDSYRLEIEKFFPDVQLYQQACPMWVPLVENGEIRNEGSDYFVRKYVSDLFNQSDKIDAVLLGCTHYPMLTGVIKKYLPSGVELLSQGPIVAKSLADYLYRHPDLERACSKSGQIQYLTTDDAEQFSQIGSKFFQSSLSATHVRLDH